MRSVGLLQRKLEELGLATISINNNPELTERVCVPRAVFIQYPFGRILGDVTDRDGQRAVCDDMLDWLEEAKDPNSYRHLPYEWPEPPEQTKWHPDIPPPIRMLRQQGKVDEETIARSRRDAERDGLE
jgi:D-proline reductase (dithiol) PrdB